MAAAKNTFTKGSDSWPSAIACITLPHRHCAEYQLMACYKGGQEALVMIPMTPRNQEGKHVHHSCLNYALLFV